VKYLIYQRVSTNMQDISTQKDRCVEYVENKGGQWRLFQDEDVSSRIPLEKRWGLVEMLQSVKKGDVVVTAKLDRLSRDIIEMVEIHRRIRDKGGKVHSLAEPNIEDWMLGIFGALAQKERENTSERITASLQAKAARGERAGHIPYGFQLAKEIYRISSGKKQNKGVPIMLKENPEEMLVLKEMARLRFEKVPYRRMAQILNDRGFRNRDGQRWTVAAVHRVYTGASKKNLEYAL
jgi:DNA invertase Pin-like site-specific DNA recombinase